MKTKKRLKLALMILVCLTLILVGFVGIYAKQLNQYVNKIADYQFAPDIKGQTILELEPDDSKETKYYDKDGKEVDASTVTDKNKSKYTKKEEPANAEESLTLDNYKKCIEIFQKRLQFLQADEYHMDLDKTNGKMILTFNDDYPEDIESILPMEGKLELVDTKTEDVILDYSHVKNITVTYAQEEGYSVYLNLKLTKEGLEKVNSWDAYKTSKDDNGEETTNNFKVKFDDEEVGTISYEDVVVSGKNVRVTLAKDITSTQTMNTKMNTATVVAKLTNFGKLPVVYNINAKEYVSRASAWDSFKTLMVITIVLAVFIAAYIVIKYKLNGLLAVLGMITNIAVLFTVMRLTNITLSYNSLAAMMGLLLMNTYLVIQILENIEDNKDKTVWQNVKLAYQQFIDVAVVAVILFAVFAFASMTTISSMGLLFFWGWVVVMLGNLAFTSMLLAIKNK